MAENRRGKDRRYFFTLGQMVLLGTAFVLTSVIVFFLGILIGKGIEARKVIRPEEPLVKVPIKPSVQGSAGTAGAASKEELTFYETLTKSPHPEPGLDRNGYGKDEKESGKPLKREPPKDSKPDSNRVVAAPPRKAPEKKIEQAPPPDPPASAQSAETAERKENGKVWMVQVNAYPDERSARQLVDRLKNKGYNALMTETRNKGKLWYRVRVGSYGSREEADKALEELKSKEKFESAFATSRQ
jgi:cell division septation protein DedD